MESQKINESSTSNCVVYYSDPHGDGIRVARCTVGKEHGLRDALLYLNYAGDFYIDVESLFEPAFPAAVDAAAERELAIHSGKAKPTIYGIFIDGIPQKHSIVKMVDWSIRDVERGVKKNPPKEYDDINWEGSILA